MSYQENITKLEEIVRMMQSDKCDIDHLAEYTRQASELIAKCRASLTATEEQLRDTLASLRQEQ